MTPRGVYPYQVNQSIDQSINHLFVKLLLIFVVVKVWFLFANNSYNYCNNVFWSIWCAIILTRAQLSL